MELSGDDLVMLALLRGRGGLTTDQASALGLTTFDVRRRLRSLNERGLVEKRLELHLINDAGLAALKQAVHDHAQALAEDHGREDGEQLPP
jgi:predicted transcriptional regulator